MLVRYLLVSLPERLHLGRGATQEFFRALPVYTVDNHADSHLVGVERRLVGPVFFLLDIHGSQQPDILQSVQQIGDQPDRYVVLVRQFDGCVGLLIVLKPKNDTMQQVQGQKIFVPPRHGFQVFLVLKLLVVLNSEAQFGANQNEQTGPLQPHHNDRYSGKRTINDTCASEEHNHVHRQHLQQLEERTHYHGREDCAGEVYLRVRDSHVHPQEHQPCYNELHEPNHRAVPVADLLEQRNRFNRGVDKNAHARGGDHQYGHHEQNCDICGQLAQDRARLLDVPNGVERLLHVAEETIYRPNKDEQSYTDERAALSRLQIAVDHSHDLRHNVRLAEHGLLELLLDNLGKPETFGYGEHHCQDWNDSKHKVVSQCVGCGIQLLGTETSDYQNQGLEHSEAYALDAFAVFQFAGRPPPEVILNEMYYLLPRAHNGLSEVSCLWFVIVCLLPKARVGP